MWSSVTPDVVQAMLLWLAAAPGAILICVPILGPLAGNCVGSHCSGLWHTCDLVAASPQCGAWLD